MTRIIASMFTRGSWALAAFAALSTGIAYTQISVAQDATAPPGGTIAYVLTSTHWAIYRTKDKDTAQDCPDGYNIGPRDQYAALFPKDGQKYTLLQTQLRREIDVWFPTTASDKFGFRYAVGPTTPGMNLDGKIGPNDFTSPDGEKGIDNQLYRVLGCINSYKTGGNDDFFGDQYVTTDPWNRVVIVLTGVDSLVDSPHVEVTVARGLDPVLADATGTQFMSGGTQRIDFRWGANYIRHLHGQISNGVLTTEPEDVVIPWTIFGNPENTYMRAGRFRLKLTPKSAEGMLGGYANIETLYRQIVTGHSTHDASYGDLSQPSYYKALHHVADAYPDPKTGENTAVSSALLVKFVQVFIMPDSQSKLTAFEPKHYLTPYAGKRFPRSPAVEAREPGVPISVVKAAGVSSTDVVLTRGNESTSQ